MSERVTIAHVGVRTNSRQLNREMAMVQAATGMIGKPEIRSLGGMLSENFETASTLEQIHETLKKLFPAKTHSIFFNETASGAPGTQDGSTANFAVIRKAPPRPIDDIIRSFDHLMARVFK